MAYSFLPSRRWALVLLLPLLAATLWIRVRPAAADEATKTGKLWVYVGTYTGKKSQGIYRFGFDLATGQLTGRALAGKAVNPSFVAIHPNHKFLYAVGEVDDFAGKKTGGISAFAIDPKTGDLKLLNQHSSGGAGPCHLVVDKSGKNVLAANYSGGSVCVLPVSEDGTLGEATAVVQHRGSSVNKDRQAEPHAHSINLDAANRFAFAADLGLDKVMIYRFDPDKHTLDANDPAAADITAGSGPRHFAFHPDGRHAYVINEILSTVTAMDYDAERGALKPVQTVSALPEDFKGKSWTAEVVVHPSGKFVYGSNRGHDSIAIFSVDARTGTLKPVGHQASGIKTPRNFAIDPTGAYLLVANQDSDSIVVFRIDPQSGELAPVSGPAEVPMPVCIRMMAPPE
jgi:6-phosphogluconolactonase